MAKLYFQPQYHGDVSHLLKPIKKTDPSACLTFVINTDSCQIVGGLPDQLEVITMPIDKEWGLKSGKWMIYTSSFIEFWSEQEPLIKQKSSFYVDVIYDDNRNCPLIESFTEKNSRLYIQSQPPYEDHLAFISLTQSAFCRIIPTDSARVILEIAETHRPFDTFEINKEEKKLKIERDNLVIPHSLPEELEPDFNLLLNKASVDQLHHLCQTTAANSIQIYTDDERAIFSDGQRTLTSSLLSLRDYAQKQEVQYRCELTLLVNIFEFKQQIDSYRNIALLKKANEALLYVDASCVMLAGLTSETGENRFISTKSIKINTPTIYRINLSELSKVPINDITSAKQIKLQMLKNNEGDYKLGFYNDLDNLYPYASVYDVNIAPEKMDMALKAKVKLEEHLNMNQRGFGEQMDAIGYDDI